MGLTLYNIKKWFKMGTGKSILHVNQNKGKYYTTDKITGYYNDLTEKVLSDFTTAEGELPIYPREDGKKSYFSISIFQYGLGSYDLFLATKSENYLNKFKLCAEWALKNQDENGGWKTFEYATPNTPYSAMAQGEGISLMLRAYTQFSQKEYFASAKKGIKFLIKDIKDGGVSLYKNKDIYLKEFVTKPVVLNGWIFSIFGIYDYILIVKDDKEINDFYKNTVNTLINSLPNFDNGYWSKYDIDQKVASPFYHKLHIGQLEALYELTKENIFMQYSILFDSYSKKRKNRIKSLFKKAIQKIKE